MPTTQANCANGNINKYIPSTKSHSTCSKLINRKKLVERNRSKGLLKKISNDLDKASIEKMGGCMQAQSYIVQS